MVRIVEGAPAPEDPRGAAAAEAPRGHIEPSAEETSQVNPGEDEWLACFNKHTDDPAWKFIQKFLPLFKEYCQSSGYSHVNPDKTSVTMSIHFAALFIVREILEQDPSKRGPNFSTENLLDALNLQFSEDPLSSNGDFYTYVKDLLPSDASSHNELLKKMALTLSFTSKLYNGCLWCVPQQVMQFAQQIEKPEPTPKAQNDALKKMYREMTRFSMTDGFSDHDAQIACSSDTMTSCIKGFEDILQKETANLEAKIKEYQGTIRSAGATSEESTAGKYHKTKLLWQFAAVPEKIQTSFRQIEELQSRFQALGTACHELSVVKAKPYFSHATKLFKEMHRQSTRCVDLPAACVCLLADQTSTNDNPKSQQNRKIVAHSYLHAFNDHVIKVIFEIVGKIVEEKHGTKDVSLAQVEKITLGVVGHFYSVIRKECIHMREVKPLALHAKNLEIGKHLKEIRFAFKACQTDMQSKYAQLISFGDTRLNKAILDLSAKNFSTPIIVIFSNFYLDKSFLKPLKKMFNGKSHITPAKLKRRAEIYHVNRTEDLTTLNSKVDVIESLTIKMLLEGVRKKLFDSEISEQVYLGGKLGLLQMQEITDSASRICHILKAPCYVFTMLAVPFYLDSLDEIFDGNMPELTIVEKAKQEEEIALSEIAFHELIVEDVEIVEPLIVEDVEIVEPPIVENKHIEEAPIEMSKEKSTPIDERINVSEITQIRSAPKSPTPTPSPALIPSSLTDSQEIVVFPAFIRPRSPALLGTRKLLPAEICKTGSQIYFHQSLTLIARMIQNPFLCKSLLLSLLESVHLTLEQAATAHGIIQAGVSMYSFTTHRLSDRFRECQLVRLSPIASRIMSAGTYNARYPRINQVTQRSGTIAGRMLAEVSEKNSVSSNLLIELAQTLNNLMAQIEQKDLPSPLTAESLAPFSHATPPIPLKCSDEPEALIPEIEKSFAANSNEKTDLVLLLTEMQDLVSMINHMGGIPKELLGVVLHATYRITQYAIKNTLVLMYKKQEGEGVDIDTIPARSLILAKTLDLPEALCELIASTDMKKGLDYPLGKQSKRRPTNKEQALLDANYTSLSPPGFEQKGERVTPDQIAQEITKEIAATIKIIQDLIQITGRES